MARAPYLHVNIRPRAGRRRVGEDDIVEAVRDEHRAGRLPGGSRLPPVRVLEHQLGISKNTVQAAYDELCARGILVSKERDGVFVALEPARNGEIACGPRAAPARLSTISLRPAGRAPEVTPLGMVFVDPALTPKDRVAECFRSALNIPGLHDFYDAQGYPPLREAIARRLCARGMEVAPDDVVITTGSQQALDAACRALTKRRVALENPVYHHARALFESLNAELCDLRLDPFSELPTDEWRAALRSARPELFYTITSFHNPTGRSYSTHELFEILELAKELDFALLEDDWGSDMLSHSEYRPTLRALGGPEVLYVNSFTKKLLPSLRLGFIVGNARTVPALVAAKRVATLGNPMLIEAALTEFLERGYYDTHLSAMQAELDRRYEACLAALCELMPSGVSWTTPGGGVLVWLELPREVDLPRLRDRLELRRIAIDSQALAFSGEPHLHGFPIGYAYLSSERLRAALEVLAEEIARA